jgi:ribulose-phosphate 3-epimerase
METVLTAGANLLVAGSYVFKGNLEKNVKHAKEQMDEIIRKID